MKSRLMETTMSFWTGILKYQIEIFHQHYNNDYAPTLGTNLEGLLFKDLDPDNDFNSGSSEENSHTTNAIPSSPPLIAPSPKVQGRTVFTVSINTTNNLNRFSLTANNYKTNLQISNYKHSRCYPRSSQNIIRLWESIVNRII